MTGPAFICKSCGSELDEASGVLFCHQCDLGDDHDTTRQLDAGEEQ